MNKTLKTVSVIVALSLGACSTVANVPEGVSLQDHDYCRFYSEQTSVPKEVMKGAGGGAILGGLGGAAVAALSKGKELRGAGAGGIIGAGVGGAAKWYLAKKEKKARMDECLRERGYQVSY